jgi:hypothetical protein
MKYTILFLILLVFVVVGIQGRIIMIGDSIFDGSTIHELLESWSGEKIHNYAKKGSMITSNLNQVPSIPTQYYQNKYPAPRIVIMDGGANDIFSCSPFYYQTTLNTIRQTLNELFNDMERQNVQHVIYLGSYYVDNYTILIDYGVQMLGNVFQQALLPINFVDVRNYTIPLKHQDIHPNTQGDYILASRIWYTLKTLI